MIMTVSFSHIDDVRKILDRLIKKAEKHGVEFGYIVSDTTYYKTVGVYNTDGRTIDSRPSQTYQVEVIDIELSNTIIRANGWTVAAHVEHMDGGHNVVTPIGYTGEIPADWYTVPGNCDHCNSRRLRAKTYIVEHDGEYKQVGTSCLKEYTGISPELAIMWAQVQEMVVLDDMDSESLHSIFGGSIPSVYSVVEVVALAIDSITEFGYCKADSQKPTKDRIWKMLNEHIEPTPEAKIKAIAACEYAATYEGTFSGMGDIILNVKAIVLSEYCKYKHFGRLVYLPIAVEREQEHIAKAEARAIEAEKSDYVGNIGERITIEVSSGQLVSSFETQYGVTRVYRFSDLQGNAMTWFASKGIELNGITKVTGTIKEHSEYNGEKQTILTRCKVS